MVYYSIPNLGRLLAAADRPAKDKWVDKAMRGDIESQHSLVVYCKIGDEEIYDIKPDAAAYEYWANVIIDEARQGNMLAQGVIAQDSGGSLFGMAEQSNAYREKLMELARAGNAEAQFVAAQNLTRGREKLGWYQKSAAQNYPRAYYWLAIYIGLEDNIGNGKTADRNQFENFYYGANVPNDYMPDCQYELSICYLRGKGIEKDLERAEYWCVQAALNGYANAARTYEAWDRI